MSLKRMTRLLVSTAATAGLTFGGLALTAPAAHAATGTQTATYTCVTPLASTLPAPLNSLLGSFKVPATFSLDTLPSALTANVPVPAGVPIVGSLQFNQAGGLAGILQSVAITLNSILGPTPLNAVSTQFSNGVATISGQLGQFTPTSTLPVPIPTSFDASLLTNNPLFGLLGIKCNLDPGSVVFTPGGGTSGGGATNGVVKQGAKIKAVGGKVVRAGQKATVKVKVKTSAGQKGAGSIKAKTAGIKAQKKVLKNGKVRFVFKGLKVGKHKIKLKYAGNDYTNKATKTYTVRVVR